MSLETIADRSTKLEGTGHLLAAQPDLAARYAIRKLSDKINRTKAIELLKQLPPETTMRYLVPAFEDPTAWDAAMEVILSYGAKRNVVTPLAMTMSDPKRSRYTVLTLDKLCESDPKNTFLFLGMALSESKARVPSINYFKRAGVNKDTVTALVFAYSSHYARAATLTIADHYGTAALPYLEMHLESLHRDSALQLSKHINRRR